MLILTGVSVLVQFWLMDCYPNYKPYSLFILFYFFVRLFSDGIRDTKVSQSKKRTGMLILLYKISSCHFRTHGGLLDVGNKTMLGPTYSIKESSGPSAHTCEVVCNGWHLSDVCSDICMDQLLTVVSHTCDFWVGLLDKDGWKAGVAVSGGYWYVIASGYCFKQFPFVRCSKCSCQ